MTWVNNNLDSYKKKFNQKFDDGLDNIFQEASDMIASKRDEFFNKISNHSSQLQSKLAVLDHDYKKLSDQI